MKRIIRRKINSVWQAFPTSPFSLSNWLTFQLKQTTKTGCFDTKHIYNGYHTELSCPLSPSCIAFESPVFSRDNFRKFPNSSCLGASYICVLFPFCLISNWMPSIAPSDTYPKPSVRSVYPRKRSHHVLQDLYTWVTPPPCSVSLFISEAQTVISPLEHLWPYLDASRALILPQKFITENIQTDIVL